MIQNTFIINPIRTDFISGCIESLYKYTEMKNNRVIVVDQTKDGLKLPMDKVHMVIRPHRNLGFSKSLNEGIIHALHWRSEYITCLNDDIEFINKSWWNGIMETFNMKSENEILAVNPESIRVPTWGYGLAGKNIDILDYKREYTDEDYNFLLKGDFHHLEKKYDWLPNTFPREYHGVCDAFAAFAPVFKRKHFEVVGLWDERFYPSGGEDYHMMCKIYRKKYRAVSTRSSWVWHFWGKSKDEQTKAQTMSLPIEDERRWADITYLWPPEWNEGHTMDVWGFYTSKDGTRKPFKGREEIGIVEI